MEIIVTIQILATTQVHFSLKGFLLSSTFILKSQNWNQKHQKQDDFSKSMCIYICVSFDDLKDIPLAKLDQIMMFFLEDAVPP